MAMEATPVSSSFMDQIRTFWSSLDLKVISERIGGSSAQAVEAVIYFGISFFFGFLFKRFFRFIFISLVLTGLMVFALSYNNFISIDWVAMKAFIGFTPDVDFTTIVRLFGSQLIDWVRENVVVAVASAVGFLLGYILG